jgi:hypothetical protein
MRRSHRRGRVDDILATASGARGWAPAVLYAFGIHLHQPVGNFDAVFEQHLTDVYRPLLATLRGGGLPATIHVSGPLLDWLESRAAIGWTNSAGSRRTDVSGSGLGFDEPILAAWSSRIGWSRWGVRGQLAPALRVEGAVSG